MKSDDKLERMIAQNLELHEDHKIIEAIYVSQDNEVPSEAEVLVKEKGIHLRFKENKKEAKNHTRKGS